MDLLKALVLDEIELPDVAAFDLDSAVRGVKDGFGAMLDRVNRRAGRWQVGGDQPHIGQCLWMSEHGGLSAEIVV